MINLQPTTRQECMEALNHITDKLNDLRQNWSKVCKEYYDKKAEVENLEAECYLDVEAPATSRKDVSRAIARQTEPDLYRELNGAKGRMDDIGKAIDTYDIMRSNIQTVKNIISEAN